MNCRAKLRRFIIAALATVLVTSCYQAIATSYDSESNLVVVETLELDGNIAATADLLATNNEDVQTLCSFPARLHPASQLFLDSYIAGRIATHEFLRVFSLPNSDYIPLARCFVTIAVDGIPMP